MRQVMEVLAALDRGWIGDGKEEQTEEEMEAEWRRMFGD